MNVFFWVALAWVAINIIAKAVKAAKEQEGAQPPRPPGAARPQAKRRAVEYPEPRSGAPTAAQRFELSEVLKQIERVKRAEEVRRAGEAVRGGRELSRIRVSMSPARQEVEDRQTLETQGDTAEDQDDDIVKLVEQRRREVEAREGEISDAEYAAFEQGAKQEAAAKAPHERVRARYTAAQLRSAFIWQQILGPPVSLRDRGYLHE